MNHQPQQEITDKDGLVYRLKRPLHKQLLFWTTLVSGIVILLLTLLSTLLVFTVIGLIDENDQLKGLTNGEHSLLESYSAHAFGQAVEFPEGLKVTVNSVAPDRERSMSDESTGIAVVVSVTIENTADKAILVSPYDFGLYGRDEEVYVLDGSTFDDTQIGTNLAPGKTIRLQLIFDGEDGDTAYTVTYEDASWSKGRKH